MARTDQSNVELPDFSELNGKEWADALRSFSETNFDYIELDADHHVIQAGSGSRLLVTFEFSHDIRNNADLAQPLGLSMARRMNASVMVLLCHRPTWFRAKAVYDFFDALTDEAVFDEFDHVVFHGTGLGGYAAAAFSVAAPGSDVFVISPHATLDPRMTEWDPRFTMLRKRSFTDRYGYAPKMLDAARHTLLLYNPDDDLDAMHSALFAGPGVTRFRCRRIGTDIASSLNEMGILNEVFALALAGRLTEFGFAKLYRRRRDFSPYLRNLLTEVEDLGRPKLTKWLATSVLSRKRMRCMRLAMKRISKDEPTPDAAE